ncbi:hypothetical protein PHYSODRAFT_324389 [Phytophthora sojae]|uniref:Uncharacterized protein n=1 Tax=Phytophthora sojae (strain P6497) TaxID=1094619 RepID=G4YUY0_PHYSP|nr:hypothetical protein PHYSODRAFT_324389 [Phytophthora sojae]EGZ23146.1 hypothetical protein PHYSODRAFT_324389 [Phytophthora sojae]|eukprot:XP_009518434.1 hypothetical protein PHYSODRAFT_324389 [Phytophthora sojae]
MADNAPDAHLREPRRQPQPGSKPSQAGLQSVGQDNIQGNGPIQRSDRWMKACRRERGRRRAAQAAGSAGIGAVATPRTLWWLVRTADNAPDAHLREPRRQPQPGSKPSQAGLQSVGQDNIQGNGPIQRSDRRMKACRRERGRRRAAQAAGSAGIGAVATPRTLWWLVRMADNAPDAHLREPRRQPQPGSKPSQAGLQSVGQDNIQGNGPIQRSDRWMKACRRERGRRRAAQAAGSAGIGAVATPRTLWWLVRMADNAPDAHLREPRRQPQPGSKPSQAGLQNANGGDGEPRRRPGRQCWKLLLPPTRYRADSSAPGRLRGSPSPPFASACLHPPIGPLDRSIALNVILADTLEARLAGLRARLRLSSWFSQVGVRAPGRLRGSPSPPFASACLHPPIGPLDRSIALNVILADTLEARLAGLRARLRLSSWFSQVGVRAPGRLRGSPSPPFASACLHPPIGPLDRSIALNVILADTLEARLAGLRARLRLSSWFSQVGVRAPGRLRGSPSPPFASACLHPPIGPLDRSIALNVILADTLEARLAGLRARLRLSSWFSQVGVRAPGRLRGSPSPPFASACLHPPIGPLDRSIALNVILADTLEARLAGLRARLRLSSWFSQVGVRAPGRLRGSPSPPFASACLHPPIGPLDRSIALNVILADTLEARLAGLRARLRLSSWFSQVGVRAPGRLRGSPSPPFASACLHPPIGPLDRSIALNVILADTLEARLAGLRARLRLSSWFSQVGVRAPGRLRGSPSPPFASACLHPPIGPLDRSIALNVILADTLEARLAGLRARLRLPSWFSQVGVRAPGRLRGSPSPPFASACLHPPIGPLDRSIALNVILADTLEARLAGLRARLRLSSWFSQVGVRAPGRLRGSPSPPFASACLHPPIGPLDRSIALNVILADTLEARLAGLRARLRLSSWFSQVGVRAPGRLRGSPSPPFASACLHPPIGPLDRSIALNVILADTLEARLAGLRARLRLSSWFSQVGVRAPGRLRGSPSPPFASACLHPPIGPLDRSIALNVILADTLEARLAGLRARLRLSSWFSQVGVRAPGRLRGSPSPPFASACLHPPIGPLDRSIALNVILADTLEARLAGLRARLRLSSWFSQVGVRAPGRLRGSPSPPFASACLHPPIGPLDRSIALNVILADTLEARLAGLRARLRLSSWFSQVGVRAPGRLRGSPSPPFASACLHPPIGPLDRSIALNVILADTLEARLAGLRARLRLSSWFSQVGVRAPGRLRGSPSPPFASACLHPPIGPLDRSIALNVILADTLEARLAGLRARLRLPSWFSQVGVRAPGRLRGSPSPPFASACLHPPIGPLDRSIALNVILADTLEARLAGLRARLRLSSWFSQVGVRAPGRLRGSPSPPFASACLHPPIGPLDRSIALNVILADTLEARLAGLRARLRLSSWFSQVGVRAPGRLRGSPSPPFASACLHPPIGPLDRSIALNVILADTLEARLAGLRARLRLSSWFSQVGVRAPGRLRGSPSPPFASACLHPPIGPLDRSIALNVILADTLEARLAGLRARLRLSSWFSQVGVRAPGRLRGSPSPPFATPRTLWWLVRTADNAPDAHLRELRRQRQPGSKPSQAGLQSVGQDNIQGNGPIQRSDRWMKACRRERGRRRAAQAAGSAGIGAVACVEAKGAKYEQQ